MEVIEIETRDGLQRVPLDKPRLTIGRLPGNDIVLPFTQISRHHAEVRQRGDDWWIVDLGSTNGLHVAGLVVKEHLLRGGDRVVLAPSIALHFISQRPAQPLVVEGTTTGLPVVRPHIVPSSVASSAVDEPSRAAADELATAAAISMPRRRVGVTPPPSAVAPSTRGVQSGSPPVSPPNTEEQDLWLLAGADELATPPGPPTPNPNLPSLQSTLPSQEHDLPLSSPFALLRQQNPSTTTALPKKPILILCPVCSASTAPDSPYCWNCRQTIARPCPQCQLFLLPIQAKCPRCENPNPNAVRR